MGIKNLSRVIKQFSSEVELKELDGQRIGIDVSNYLYRAVYNKDKKGKGSHIRTFFEIIVLLLKHKIIPVFIFDGGDDLECKRNTLDDRKKTRNATVKKVLTKTTSLIEKYELPKMETTDDPEEMIKHISKHLGEKHVDICPIKKIASTVIVIDRTLVEEVVELFELVGVPYLFAPGEADILLGQLCREKKLDGVFSKDGDILTYGATNLYRDFYDFSFHRTRIMKQDSISNILDGLDISFKSFVDLCLLLGCDYHQKGVPKVGPKRAMELIQKYGSIEKIIKKEHKLAIPDDFDYKLFRKYFARSKKKSGITNEDIELYTMSHDMKEELFDFLNTNVNYQPKTIHKKIKELADVVPSLL